MTNRVQEQNNQSLVTFIFPRSVLPDAGVYLMIGWEMFTVTKINQFAVQNIRQIVLSTEETFFDLQTVFSCRIPVL